MHAPWVIMCGVSAHLQLRIPGTHWLRQLVSRHLRASGWGTAIVSLAFEGISPEHGRTCRWPWQATQGQVEEPMIAQPQPPAPIDVPSVHWWASSGRTQKRHAHNLTLWQQITWMRQSIKVANDNRDGDLIKKMPSERYDSNQYRDKVRGIRQESLKMKSQLAVHAVNF